MVYIYMSCLQIIALFIYATDAIWWNVVNFSIDQKYRAVNINCIMTCHLAVIQEILKEKINRGSNFISPILVLCHWWYKSIDSCWIQRFGDTKTTWVEYDFSSPTFWWLWHHQITSKSDITITRWWDYNL